MKTVPLAGPWQFRQAKTQEWLPAQVPGGVHTDLLALKRIPDPFVADNEKEVQWVAEKDWDYRRSFTVTADLLTEQQVFLVCDGLDTLADVQVNDKPVGHAENMFRQYRWEIKKLLKPGENMISIAFASPVMYVTGRLKEREMKGVSQAIPGGPYLRKAPCQFGWDWGPMLPPIGIWRDIRLEGRSTARLEDVHLKQMHADGKVTLEAGLKIEKWQDKPLTAILRAKAPSGKILEASTPVVGTEVTPALKIRNPQLWWPNGYGEQALYQVEVALVDEAGNLVDRKTFLVGLRTLELRQEKDKWGKSFTFVVNGVPIFAKGSDWIPTDSFPTRITDEFLFKILSDAAQTHQNMLRVWGGGLYEDDRFYNFCDQLGILIWQDFIFACSIYPLDEQPFLDNVHEEVIQNVRRLRHHACLALWCGNNEMEWGWETWAWHDPELKGLQDAYAKFFHQTLPAWVAAEDPDLPYWPSSPSSDTPFKNVNGQEQGDSHYWDVWHGRKPFTAYRDQYPRFMSEFGFQALPPFETVKTYAAEEDWNMTSYIMEHHQRSGNGNALMMAQMGDNYRLPKDFPALVYMSLVLQAEGIRYGVEHWRRNKDRVSGIIYWQLNDCWPVASWSSLDYYGRWKALHYAARRFFAPVLLSVFDHDGQMELHVTSDELCPFEGKIKWELAKLDGKVLKSGEEKVALDPLESKEIKTVTCVVAENDARDTVFLAELWEGDHLLAHNLVTFVPNKHLKLVDPHLSVGVEKAGKELAFTLKAESLARHVELKLADVDTVFSDNYFDVPAGKTVKVTCPAPKGWSAARARKALQVRSLYNAFA